MTKIVIYTGRERKTAVVEPKPSASRSICFKEHKPMELFHELCIADRLLPTFILPSEKLNLDDPYRVYHGGDKRRRV